MTSLLEAPSLPFLDYMFLIPNLVQIYFLAILLINTKKNTGSTIGKDLMGGIGENNKFIT